MREKNNQQGREMKKEREMRVEARICFNKWFRPDRRDSTSRKRRGGDFKRVIPKIKKEKKKEGRNYHRRQWGRRKTLGREVSKIGLDTGSRNKQKNDRRGEEKKRKEKGGGGAG